MSSDNESPAPEQGNLRPVRRYSLSLMGGKDLMGNPTGSEGESENQDVADQGNSTEETKVVRRKSLIKGDIAEVHREVLLKLQQSPEDEIG